MYEIMMKLKYLLFFIPKTHIRISEYQATDDVMIVTYKEQRTQLHSTNQIVLYTCY